MGREKEQCSVTYPNRMREGIYESSFVYRYFERVRNYRPIHLCAECSHRIQENRLDGALMQRDLKIMSIMRGVCYEVFVSDFEGIPRRIECKANFDSSICTGVIEGL